MSAVAALNSLTAALIEAAAAVRIPCHLGELRDIHAATPIAPMRAIAVRGCRLAAIVDW